MDLYFAKMMTLDQIGTYFGYSDRQPIIRLFKKFRIVSRTPTEVATIRFEKSLSKEQLLISMKGESILSASKKLGIPRVRLAKYLTLYDIKPLYFVHKNNKKIILDSIYDACTPIEISILTKIPMDVIKYYRKNFIEKRYNKDEIIDRINKYGYNMNSQAFAEQIRTNDMSLYNSILHHTNDHELSSKKFTERVYRIVGGIDASTKVCCKHCSSKLKFYTFEKGYGNSEHGICLECSKSINGVSLVSQKLFWDVYRSLNSFMKRCCKFSELNYEKKILITEIDKKELCDLKLNKHAYYFDFVFKNKIIEFDGTYYHKDKSKDLAKDSFVILKGYTILHIKEKDYTNNPQTELKKCLDFLNQ